MRTSIGASRNRILTAGASVLLAAAALAAAALAAATTPARAALTPVNEISLSTVGAQATDPLTTPVDLSILATETDETAMLTFSVTGLPAGLAAAQTGGAGDATLDITGTITTSGVYSVTVTATDDLPAADATSETFTWTASNTITVTVKAPKKVYLRVEVGVQPTATDSDKSQKLTWSVSPAHPLPPGLSISKTTGFISGRPQRLAAPPTTVIARDAAGSTGSAVIDWVVSVDGYLDNPGTQTFTAGLGKDLRLKTIDYVPGDKVTWKSAGLPAGMGFAPGTMMIYGWPGQAGTYHVTLTGHGSLGSYDIMTFKLVVKAATGKGATGQVHLALDGKCLRDPSGETANGTGVQIGTCASGAAQRWTVASDGTIRVNGRCLDIAGRGSSAGRPLDLWSCGNASPRQAWTQGSDGELVNPPSGLCVTDPRSSRKNGTVPVMGTCHVRSYEQWTLPAQPILTPVGGSCADDHYSQGANGSVVDMFWCNGTQGQAWSFRPDGTIRAGLYGGKCVTVRGPLGRAGTKLVLWGCTAGNRSQQWTLSRAGALGSELSLGGVCLGIPSMTAANAAQLVTAACTASDPRVHWHIQ
jgi:hypothetical protein